MDFHIQQDSFGVTLLTVRLLLLGFFFQDISYRGLPLYSNLLIFCL